MVYPLYFIRWCLCEGEIIFMVLDDSGFHSMGFVKRDVFTIRVRTICDRKSDV